MKKILLLSLCLILLPKSDLLAQDIHFGLKGGLGFQQLMSTYTDDEIDESQTSSFRLGLMAGLYLHVPLGNNLSLRPELLYSQKGGQDDFSLEFDLWGYLTEFKASSEFRFNYVDLPVLMVYDFPSERNWKPYLSGGLFAGYLLGGNYKGEFVSRVNGTVVEQESYSGKATDVLERYNFGFLIGAGLNHKRFTFDLRFENGLVNIAKDESAIGFDDFDDEDDFNSKLKTRGFVISVSYRF